MTSGRASPARASTPARSGSKSLFTTHAPSPRSLPPSPSLFTPTVTRFPLSTKSPGDARCRPIPTPVSLRLLNPPRATFRLQTTSTHRPAAPSPIRPRHTRPIIRLPLSTAVAGLIDIAKLSSSTPPSPPVLTTPRHQGPTHPMRLWTGTGTRCMPTTHLTTTDILLTGGIQSRRWKQISAKNLPTTDLPRLLSTGVHPVLVFPKPCTVLGVTCRTRARRHQL